MEKIFSTYSILHRLINKTFNREFDDRFLIQGHSQVICYMQCKSHIDLEGLTAYIKLEQLLEILRILNEFIKLMTFFRQTQASHYCNVPFLETELT